MRYAGLKLNDTVDCETGICVSLWTQGCPHHCVGCHNPQTWDYEGGMEVPLDLRGQIIKAISDHNVNRSFSVLGGEPLCYQNKEFVDEIITAVRVAYPNIKIYVWTGYTLEELQSLKDENINNILKQIDVLIDGRFNIEKRDIRNRLYGSTNQRVLRKGIDF